jgi:predicted nucleic acid-binding protein
VPIVYVETSALIKKYIQEVGSDVIGELFEHQSTIGLFSISVLATLELKSALARLQRGGRITDPDRNDLLAEFWSDSTLFSIAMSVDNLLLDEAGEFLDKSALRTLDAMHFASAMRLKSLAERTDETLVMVTSDLELVSAWEAEGFVTINPEHDQALEQVRGLISG